MSVLEWILAAAGGYVALGLLFALPFCFRWVGRVDPQAASAGLGLRLLLLPGSVAFWPYLLRRLLGTTRGESG